MGRMIIGGRGRRPSSMFFDRLHLLRAARRSTTSPPDRSTDAQAAAVQQSLWPNLTQSAPAPIVSPEPESSPPQTVMYGQGPIATIHYNTSGFRGDGH